MIPNLIRRARRLLACAALVAAITFVAFRVAPVNATTVGFAYLLLILVIASAWGFSEAAFSSVLATLTFNFFFFPPVGTFTIADPQNWVALFSFLMTSLVASRLSTHARLRAQEAVDRQQGLERLYSFSRAILLTDPDETLQKQLVQRLADIFQLDAAVLHDRRTGEFYRAGPSEFDGLDEQLREAAFHGTSFRHTRGFVTAISLGSQPIASLAIQGGQLPDSVVQGIANLVSIGLERARAEELSHEMQAARQSEHLRTTLIDAMAHEFKTPLTLIKGVTSSLLGGHDDLSESAREQLIIADEESEHLRDLLDDAIEMARLDVAHIDVHLEPSSMETLFREVITSMNPEIAERAFEFTVDNDLPDVALDRRLIKLAAKQLVDNAIKYSPPESAVTIRLHGSGTTVFVDVSNCGPGIPVSDQKHIFERFYRGRLVRNQIPGSGLGLNIAQSVLQAHRGDITMTSRPGATTFRMILPTTETGAAKN